MCIRDSYGGTFVAEKTMKVATVPVGYGDGYPRSLSNKGWVLIRGQKAPILGRVCMDQMMVDVSALPEVKEGDQVTPVSYTHLKLCDKYPISSIEDGLDEEDWEGWQKLTARRCV